jgi:glycosyltransferase involved in cell wall biosynthesis
LCYAGYVNAANARDVRSLYLAVAMLNREGTPTTLVRAGRDYYPFLGSDDQWARKYCLELGYVEKHTDIPLVLSLADILIQPGKNSNFNDYRGTFETPGILRHGATHHLPHTNVGRFVKHGEHAWVLPEVDAMGIVTAVQYLQKDHSLVKRLSEGAREFYEKHFQWEMNTVKLEQFYRTVLGGKHMTNEAVEKGPDHRLSRPILTRT